MAYFRDYNPEDIKGRVCVKCGEWKERSEFHAHAKCYGGINTVCKTCRKVVSKANYRKQDAAYKLWYGAKARAKKMGLEFTIEIEDIVIPERCPILGIPMTSPSLDQTIPRGGYTPENTVVVSRRANTLKNNGTLGEFYKIVAYLEKLEGMQNEA